MAISKVKALHGKLDNVISYITNFDKTMQGDLIYSYNCSPAFAARQMDMIWECNRKSNATRTGYHLIQSFDPEDDITPEKAFELGKEFARKVVGKNKQYILSTHVDKEHIHNHIVFNSVPFQGDSLRMYRWTPAEGRRIEAVNDAICEKYGCSFIEKKSGVRGKSWSQHSKENKTDKALSTIRGCVDLCVNKVDSIEELSNKLNDEYGIEMRIGKTITFSIYDENFDAGVFKCRDRKLGAAYSVEALENRINGIDIGPNLLTKKVRSGIEYKRKRINRVVNVTSNQKAINSAAYSNALYSSNASAKIQTFNYIIERGFKSEHEFIEHYFSIEDKLKENNKAINEYKERAEKISERISQVKKYRDNKKIYTQYMNCSDSEKESFKEKHNSELTDFFLAEIYFSNLVPPVNPYKISLKDLFNELKICKEDKEKLFDENKAILKELKETKTVVYNAMKTLNLDTSKLRDYSKGKVSKSEKNLDEVTLRSGKDKPSL